MRKTILNITEIKMPMNRAPNSAWKPNHLYVPNIRENIWFVRRTNWTQRTKVSKKYSTHQHIPIQTNTTLKPLLISWRKKTSFGQDLCNSPPV